VKSLLFGARRSAAEVHQPVGSVEAALAPALVDGKWRVPSRFNFTRDVVEALATDKKRRALTHLGHDVVIEPTTFFQLAQGAARWATLLREAGVRPGDRMLVLAGTSTDWVEVMLGAIKIGAVTVPSTERLTASALDIRLAAAGAKVAVASSRAEIELAGCTRPVTVLSIDAARSEAQRLPSEAPSHDTGARDAAFVVSTRGRGNGPRGVLHTHASTFAARVHAEHWLDAGLGDVVWCTTPAHSPQTLWSSLLGPWARGASVVLHDGAFEPVERLDLMQRLGVTVLCQSPGEYRALAETGRLGRYRWARPRRLVSTGAELEDDVVQAFEDEWGLTIQDGLGLAEAGVVVGHWGDGAPRGSLGRPLPGNGVAVIDEGGNQLPDGYAGDLALHRGPASLFGGYWNAPDATRAAYRGDWFVTGDVAVRDEDGFFWLEGRRDLAVLRPSEPSVELPVEEPPAPVAPAPAVSVAAPRATAPPAPDPPAPDPPVAVVAPPEPRVERPRPAPAPAPAPVAAEPPPPAATPDSHEPPKRRPYFARLTATLWLLAAGVLIGGVAIPHAQDKPRIVPKSEDAPNAICLTRTSRR
jgi:acyl-coenzyme A synthetase/AMP-(fatty) acid ligase